MDASDDIVESTEPPMPPGAERRTNLLLQTVAVAAVATAAFTGITAWETHQQRIDTKATYCSFMSNPEADPQQEQLSDQLGC